MFRFTIRDVLWLMVVAAMGALLWKERASMERERASLRAQQLALEAKNRQLDAQFLRMVQATDELNMRATAEIRP